VTAYTIGFEESKFSEIPYARQAAEQLGVDLRCEIVRPDVVSTLERLFTNYGEPFADTSAVPTSYVSELARQDVPMVLSGDGADEAFAGYQRYGWWLDDSLLADLRLFHKYPKRLVRRIAEGLRKSVDARSIRWQENFIGLMDQKTRARLWHDEYHDVLEQGCPAFEKAACDADNSDKLSLAQSIDIRTYLPGDILTKVDIASMQHGLEVRTPFTDVKMMEFAATLPFDQRAYRDASGARVLKPLPKRLLGREFSRDFVNRKKMGFAIPEADWMTKGNPVRSCFDDLTSGDARVFDFLKRDALVTMVEAFDTHRVHAASLWSVFSLAFWLDRQANVATKKQAA
jgi:asparagine synthase (glutamine-hydrolysing)